MTRIRDIAIIGAATLLLASCGGRYNPAHDAVDQEVGIGQQMSSMPDTPMPAAVTVPFEPETNDSYPYGSTYPASPPTTYPARTYSAGTYPTPSTYSSPGIYTTAMPMPGIVAASPTFSQQDVNFVRTAAASGSAEIELAQLASSRAVTPQVRDFAYRMLNDHRLMADDLDRRVIRRGMTVSWSPDPDDVTTYNRLASLSGEDFDRAYMEHMVMAHERALRTFQRQVGYGQDPDLREGAQAAIPVVQGHLAMAREVRASL